MNTIFWCALLNLILYPVECCHLKKWQEHLFIVTELLRANLYEFQKYNQESGDEVYFSLRRIQVCLTVIPFSLRVSPVVLLWKLVTIILSVNFMKPSLLKKSWNDAKVFTSVVAIHFSCKEISLKKNSCRERSLHPLIFHD